MGDKKIQKVQKKAMNALIYRRIRDERTKGGGV